MDGLEPPPAPPPASSTPMDATQAILSEIVSAKQERYELMGHIRALSLQFTQMQQAPGTAPAQAPAPAPPTASTSYTGNNLRLPKIQQFTGERENDLEPWLSQTRSIVQASDNVRLTDSSCVSVVHIFLVQKARLVFDAQVTATGSDTAGCHNWDQFAALLRRLLGPHNSDITGRQRLRDLRQTGSVSSYTATFLRLARSLETPMQDLDLREFFVGGLKLDVQQYIRQQFPATFHDAHVSAALYDTTFYRKASSGNSNRPSHSASRPQPMDLGYTASSSRHGRSRSRTSSRASSRSRSPGPRNRSPSAERLNATMSERPRLTTLTPEERERCMRENLCFRCRKPGHPASRCPLASRRPPTPARKN